MDFLAKLRQIFFCWKVEPCSERRLKDAQVIIAQSFGLREKDPGLSNKALANYVKHLHLKYSLPLVLQWEIADCLPDMPKAGVIRHHRTKGEYLDTREVLIQAKEICQSKIWSRALIVAHPDHMWRVARTAEKLGFIVVIADTGSIPYDKDSTQWWTKGRGHFLPYDLMVRVFYLLKGWI